MRIYAKLSIRNARMKVKTDGASTKSNLTFSSSANVSRKKEYTVFMMNGSDYKPMATSYSDFLAPTKLEQESQWELDDKPMAIAYSDFVAPSREEQKALWENDNKPLATSYSDFLAPTLVEQTAPSSISFLFENWRHDKMPMATAYSDIVAPTVEEQRQVSVFSHIFAMWSRDTMSLATPYSDFVAPSKEEQDHSRISAFFGQNDKPFATAYSDYVAPTTEEQENDLYAFLMHQRTSEYQPLSTALSDVMSPSMYEQEHQPQSHDNHVSLMQYSFASPESDFVSNVNREEYFNSDTIMSKTRNQASTLPQTYAEAIQNKNDAIVLTSTSAPFRIVSVNAAWEKLCGYSNEECVGKTLKILQGAETDVDKVNESLSKLKKGIEVDMVLTNYAKNGRKFRNNLKMGPLRNGNSESITHFVAILEEVAADEKHNMIHV